MSSVQKPKGCLSLVMYIRPTLMSQGIFTSNTLTSSRPTVFCERVKRLKIEQALRVAFTQTFPKLLSEF